MYKKPFKYRDAMQELNEILDSLQSEDIDVDELSSKVKRAFFTGLDATAMVTESNMVSDLLKILR